MLRPEVFYCCLHCKLHRYFRRQALVCPGECNTACLAGINVYILRSENVKWIRHTIRRNCLRIYFIFKMVSTIAWYCYRGGTFCSIGDSRIATAGYKLHRPFHRHAKIVRRNKRYSDRITGYRTNKSIFCGRPKIGSNIRTIPKPCCISKTRLLQPARLTANATAK